MSSGAKWSNFGALYDIQVFNSIADYLMLSHGFIVFNLFTEFLSFDGIAKDGTHWEPRAHRYMTTLLLDSFYCSYIPVSPMFPIIAYPIMYC